MSKLKSIIWIRPVAVVVLVVAVFLFTESYIVSNYLQAITGTKASGRIALFDFFKGEIALKNVLIYSPERYYGGVRSIYIKKIVADPDYSTLFSKNRTIKAVNVNGVIINNIYINNGENNIEDILSHSIKHFQDKENGGQHCKIQRFSISNIAMNTFHGNGYPATILLPDIRLKSIKTNSDSIDSIALATTYGVQRLLAKNDGRSFWQKTGDIIGTGLGITFDVLNIATGVTNAAARGVSYY